MEKTSFRAAMPLVRNIALGAVRRGADIDELCRAIGVTPAALEDPEATANLEQRFPKMGRQALVGHP
jgi:hypothetical protein